MAAAPEQYRTEHSPRPRQTGLSHYRVHRGRAERIKRLFREEELEPGKKRPSLLAILSVDGALCSHARSKGRAWPYVATLAEETNVSVVTVKRATAWLESHGLLHKQRTGRYNVYRPVFLVVEGTPQKGPGDTSKEGVLLCASGTQTTTPRTEQPACDKQPPEATPNPEPEKQPDATRRFLQALRLFRRPMVELAIRNGGSVAIADGVCVLRPGREWQADVLRKQLWDRGDRARDLVNAAEIAFGEGVRVRVAEPGG